MVMNVGLIGCGTIAQRHIADLANIPEAKIVAFCDIDLSKAEKAAKAAGAKAYADHRAMLKRERLDAVYVCLPPFAHGLEVDVVEKGVNLFVEKPVALTMEVARRVERAVEKAGVLSSVGYNFRYYDTTSIAKRALEENGPIGLVHGYWIRPPPSAASESWWIRKEKSGGQIVEQSTHIFDLARYMAGDVKRVYAEVDTILNTDIPGSNIEDISVVTLRFKSGAIGIIKNSCASQKTFRGQYLSVLAKRIFVEHGGHSGIVKLYGDNEIREIRPTTDQYIEEDKAFVRAVASGDKSPIKSSYSDAVKSVQLSLVALESSEKKQAITI